VLFFLSPVYANANERCTFGQLHIALGERHYRQTFGRCGRRRSRPLLDFAPLPSVTVIPYDSHDRHVPLSYIIAFQLSNHVPHPNSV
jgi:hypothetical protein